MSTISNMVTSAVLLKFVLTNFKFAFALSAILNERHFLSLFQHKSAIFQYGYQRANFKLNFIWLCVSRKELAEAVRFRIHNWNILGSNPAALNISF